MGMCPTKKKKPAPPRIPPLAATKTRIRVVVGPIIEQPQPRVRMCVCVLGMCMQLVARQH